MRKSTVIIQCISFFVFAFGVVQAEPGMVDTTIGGLRIELHVLPAEPFFTMAEVVANKVTDGMLIMGGAKPMAPDAAIHPNHHLVIHVFNLKTGNAITDAKVKMSFQLLDSAGKPSGKLTVVPIVVMQAIGKGVQSTHYGNNVVMPTGTYAISIVVNGRKVNFKLDVPDASGSSMDKMNMN